ncbi:L-type lectin-domain containing receptor kinase S.4 [Spatholobus suberectus]|nr:L-type lectin-domain containing receptor kinase S.4 [Spatholobus suberectus]
MRQVVRYLDGEVEVPGDLRKPGDLSHPEGFDEFLHSLASSSFDKMSSSSNFGIETWILVFFPLVIHLIPFSMVEGKRGDSALY